MKMSGRLKRITVVVGILALCSMLCACGGKKSSKAEPTQVIPKASDEPTAVPTETPELTPTPSPFPEVKEPTYKFTFIDHGKLYDRYYSSYYFEFDEPGYYIPGKLSKAGFSNTETGEKVGSPDKVITGELPEENGDTRYFAVMIFMSKNDNLVSENLSFEPEVKYRYDKANTTKVEIKPFVVNTKKEDIDFNKPEVKSYPFCLEGHYLVQDLEISATHFGSPEDDKTKDFAGLEYFFIRLSYDDMDYDAMKKHFEIVGQDKETKQLIPYIPVEGFEKYIGVSQTTDDGLRYFRVTFGLAYKKGLSQDIVNAIPDEVKNNMVLVYKL